MPHLRKTPRRNPCLRENKFDIKYILEEMQILLKETSSFFLFEKMLGIMRERKETAGPGGQRERRECNKILIRKLRLTLKALLCHRVSPNFIQKISVYKHGQIKI